MPDPPLNVRYRVRSGKHLLAASISGFDPSRTLAIGQDMVNELEFQ
jgi:hypothetical protein